jgi:DNA-binding CsgD family transcriptional regulator
MARGYGEEGGLSVDAPTRLGVPLAAREREAAALVAEGLRDRQIAARLCISERTVHAHLRAAFAKTGSRSRVMLALWVSHQDWPSPQVTASSDVAWARNLQPGRVQAR